MKQIFIFGTDKTFTVIFFSVLHDVITYGFGIIIDEQIFLYISNMRSSSANSNR